MPIRILSEAFMRDCTTMGYIELEKKYRPKNDDRIYIFRFKKSIWISW